MPDRRRLCLLVVAAMALAAPAPAQYFGANKVRYDTPSFRVLSTEHFDIYSYPKAHEAAAQAARLAERWHARLSQFFDHQLEGRQPLVLYASPFEFRQTNVVEGTLGEGTGGVTESLRRRIVLPLAGSLAATDHVLGHELVHAFQFDITARARSESRGRVAGAATLPLWFVEGMAEYLSRGPVDPETAMWLRDALAHDALPSVRKLGDPKYFPYRWGHALWAYIAGRWGDAAVATALSRAGRSGSAETALESTLGVSMETLTVDWHAAIRETYGPWLSATAPPDSWARSPFPARRERELTVGPALSPDGRWLAILSARDLLSVDLYVADVERGRFVTRVASTTRDSHLTSLQYIASAGAWDSAGRRLAFASRRGRHATIEIYDVEARRRLPPVTPADVDELLAPAWSPDGTRLAFVGMRRGVTDLFVADVASGKTAVVTDDGFAELHPVWSPDGRALVFATDRFTTADDPPTAGRYQLARVVLDGGRVERLVAPRSGHMLSPQWTDRSGDTLLFVGTEGGAPNVWRADLRTGAVTRLSDLTTGVAGITMTSPALSTAPDARRLAFTSIAAGGVRVFVRDLDDATASARVVSDEAGAVLPPAARVDSTVRDYLADARTGMPDRSVTFDETPYRSRLGLDAVVQPSVGIGVDRFGAFAGGQVALLWGDMLGDRSLVTAFQAATTLDASFSYRDLGGLVSYVDRSKRWSWVATVEQSPYRTGYVQGGVGRVNGQPAYVEQDVVFRQTLQSVSGVVAYPLSESRRLEAGAGVQRFSFSEHTRTIASVAGRTVLDEQSTTVFPGLSLARTMAAYVYDRSVFGATGPVTGERYRFEAAPTFGTLRYTGLLADYRRYVMPVSFYTVAGRVMHYGRYGAGGDDVRLAPLFLGYPELVRGYDVGSFRATECEADACPVFDRLVGSRVLVANAELRFPLLRPFGVGSGMYGPLPVEVALFGDAGVAWDRRSTPTVFGGERDWVTSAGAAARVNVFGLAVVQLSAARPFQRPGRGWVYQVSLTPGF